MLAEILAEEEARQAEFNDGVEDKKKAGKKTKKNKKSKSKKKEEL